MGEVYGYVIEDKDGKHQDSYWGYYGSDHDYITREAKGQIDWEINHQQEAIEQQIKNESFELQFA